MISRTRRQLPLGRPGERVDARDAGWNIGAPILLLIFAYFWISLAPFAAPSGEQDSASSGSLLNQITVTLLFLIAMTTLGLDPKRRALFAPRGLLLLTLCWFSFVSIFASDPETAFRRIAYAVLVCGCANAVLLLPRASDEFARLLAIAVAAVLFLSYFAVIVLPDVGIHRAREVEAALAGDWRGIFGHKNAAAAAMAYVVLFGLYLRQATYPKLGTAIAILAAIFLFFTRGKTASAILPAILLLAWMFEHSRSLRPIVTLGCVAVFNFILIGLSRSQVTMNLLEGLGIDATFTGRSEIWAFTLDRISEQPFTGYGFQSFWYSNRQGEETTETWAILAAHSHNSFLEALLNAGVPGLLMIVVWLLVLPLRDASSAFSTGNDPALTRLFLRIWIFSILLACLESLFFVNTGPLWFTMLIAVFGMRLQARASLTAGVPPSH